MIKLQSVKNSMIGILGSVPVARTIGLKLLHLGHEVLISLKQF